MSFLINWKTSVGVLVKIWMPHSMCNALFVKWSASWFTSLKMWDVCTSQSRWRKSKQIWIKFAWLLSQALTFLSQLMTNNESTSRMSFLRPKLQARESPYITAHSSASAAEQTPILIINPPYQWPKESFIIPHPPAKPGLPLLLPLVFSFTSYHWEVSN